MVVVVVVTPLMVVDSMVVDEPMIGVRTVSLLSTLSMVLLLFGMAGMAGISKI